ncbi:hypothetical protein HanXRQr2_Chr13g0566561 [Helianthus annuus]|uniref:Uncharacterized protein n=1 Tax=Helianthus annuus TaxID=4232 RepID=A0A9K3EFB6_HELAN|nr:hypothetical protein HanXRQr2_Chr13g0566561 [Helianthus annuus]KAJ0847460.1 hypothetical protein HanPSC8_Chr13g0545581 [Helianthus annuus]
MIHSFASLKTSRRVIFLAVVCFAMFTKVITNLGLFSLFIVNEFPLIDQGSKGRQTIIQL